MVITTKGSTPKLPLSGALCSRMKLESPKLKNTHEATEELIESIISELKVEQDAFVILSKDELNYVQALNTEKGFIVRFQEGSIDKHYEFEEYLDKSKTIGLFKVYKQDISGWQGKNRYFKVNLRGFIGGLGYKLGKFVGSFARGIINIFRQT